MITHTPWAIRLLVVPCRLVFYVARAIIAAIGADTAAATILGGLILAVTLLVPLLVRTVVVTDRWISRRLATHRKQQEQRAFEEIVEHFHDSPAVAHNESTQELPGVVRITPTVPLPTRELQRRTRARSIRRRLTRRPKTSSSSDRRTR